MFRKHGKGLAMCIIMKRYDDNTTNGGIPALPNTATLVTLQNQNIQGEFILSVG